MPPEFYQPTSFTTPYARQHQERVIASLNAQRELEKAAQEESYVNHPFSHGSFPEPPHADVGHADDNKPSPSPTHAEKAPSHKTKSMSSKTKKDLAIAGGVTGAALAVAGAGYYAWKAYETGGESLFHDEEPHIGIPTTDPDPAANGLNSAIQGMRNW